MQAQVVTIYPNNSNEIAEFVGDYYPVLKLIHIKFLFKPLQAYDAGANIATFSIQSTENRLVPIHAWGNPALAKFMRHSHTGYLTADTAIEASSGQFYVDYWIKTV